MGPSDIPTLLDLALRLAADAARLLRDGLAQQREVLGTKSSLTDLVTATDRSSERLIVEGIRSARPGDAILGEEGTADTGTTEVRWVIDPLDGTTNYLYGLPAFAASIAVEVAGVVEAGVVADAGHDETFWAVRGGGAWRDGQPIRCSQATDLGTALIGTGFSYESARRARQGAVAAKVLPSVRDIRRVGAASIDLCWVGCGRLDGFYERGLQPWDHAAGTLVAAEGGALVGDLAGGPPSGAFALAAAPGLFGPLRTLLDGAGAGDA
jgi:myo-inositol-1(or 4)-monophosphatase